MTSIVTLKTAFRNCRKTIDRDCTKIKNLLSEGDFDNRAAVINEIRVYTEEKTPYPISRKEMSLLLLNNNLFYRNASQAEIRELLDMISGFASIKQDKDNGGKALFIKRPFIYRENVKRVSTETGLGRSYDIPGLGLKSWPSVTGVYSKVHPFDPTLWINKLKRLNPDWDDDDIEQEMERVRIESSTRGSMMHEAIETYLKDRVGFDIKMCDLAGRPYFKCILDYLRYEIDAVIAIEPLAYIDMSESFNKDIGCMGYIDLIGTHNGKNVVYDWKTADKPKDSRYIENYFIQVAAYAAMIFHTYGLKIDEARLVVAIKDRDSPQVFTLDRDGIKDYLRKFLSNLKKYDQLINA